ncbi:MAG: hypothetical protein HQ512_12250 [Rhodospirillales bacterium]|nr:hypothetical protein [Rhodospirillales bacterium]
MSDDVLKAAKDWMKHFQGLSFDAASLADPARAGEKVGERLRELSETRPFGGQPSPFTKTLESFAVPEKNKNG